jgi:hypothetical protein
MFIGESSENLRRLRHAAQIDTISLFDQKPAPILTITPLATQLTGQQCDLI